MGETRLDPFVTAEFPSPQQTPNFHRCEDVSLCVHGERRSRVLAAGAAIVVVVSAVPVFAQSNSWFSIARADPLSSFAMREYVADAEALFPPVTLPPNLIAAAVYRELLESMLERSATFRRQCRRLAGTPALTVTLRPAPAALSGVRARTRFGRAGGVLVAAVEILTLHDPVELIAHEIEHVIEQLDGVDLVSKAFVAQSGVQAARNDATAFETTRATRVGLRVAGEVRRAGG